MLLLGYALTTNNARHDLTSDRITRLENEDTVNTRFDDVDAEFAKVDARFGCLEDAVGEINVKLAALIAHLDKTGEVEAAVEGRIEDTAGPRDTVG